MIIDNTNYWHSPVRSFTIRVELYVGSALVDAYTAYYALKDFSVERVGEENKFFGFGICQKMNMHLVDKDRLINITTENSCKNYLSTGGDLITTFPTFYVSEVHRDEKTNELSVTAYDKLYAATAHTVEELKLVAPYTIRNVAEACANLLGISAAEDIGITEENNPFDNSYPEGANFDGTETIREALNAIAEATQTIYYIDKDEKLIFKRLDITGNPVLIIDKEKYIELDSNTNRRLATIVSTTELGDSVSASLEESGSTQYIRENPFWDIQENIGTLIENALAAIGGLTINQFDCYWRGNAALEVGDKIGLITKDNKTVNSFVLNDTITYDGGLSEQTSWSYTDTNETASNPSTLGEALKQTFAKVDKANKEITLLASENSENKADISQLKIDTASITTTVSSTKKSIDDLTEDISDIQKEVSTKTTPEAVTIAIRDALNDGVKSVKTETGFEFNSDGLSITRSDSEISTLINEDGMRISKNSGEVLTADNTGVNAINLTARQYLIIGTNSRFEDYGTDRTGCFYVGG